MTNEERKLALYCLKANSDFHKEVCEECDMYPSCDHFIQDSVMEKLIEELELEPCDDVISMMDLLNNLHKHFSKGFETDEWWNSTHVLQAVKDCRPELFDLNYVSPVQPKPKTGQWVLLDECSNSGYYCSECHKKLVKEGWSNTVKKVNYCPNCGCRMVEPQAESESKG